MAPSGKGAKVGAAGWQREGVKVRETWRKRWARREEEEDMKLGRAEERMKLVWEVKLVQKGDVREGERGVLQSCTPHFKAEF